MALTRRISVNCRCHRGWLTAAALVVICACAHGTPSASHRVTIAVQPIDRLGVVIPAEGISFVFAEAPAGGIAPAQVSAGGRLQWTTNAAAPPRKITAQLDTVFPTGINLNVTVTPPSGSHGISSGRCALSDRAVQVVGGLYGEACLGAELRYEAQITEQATLGSFARTVTYTLSD